MSLFFDRKVARDRKNEKTRLSRAYTYVRFPQHPTIREKHIQLQSTIN